MQLHYVNNPMYALCLLAAVCVRQHVQNGMVQPLTKGVSLQRPMSVFMKPTKASLKIVNDTEEVESEIKSGSTKYPKLEEANALVSCVQNFGKRTHKVVDDIQPIISLKKKDNRQNAFFPYNVSNWVLYLVNNIGVKWLA